jgi:hypothetical protein
LAATFFFAIFFDVAFFTAFFFVTVFFMAFLTAFFCAAGFFVADLLIVFFLAERRFFLSFVIWLARVKR